jgi:hypothetical protein
MIPSWRVRVEQISSKVLFSGLFQQGSCGVRVAHRGLLIEPEDLCEMQWVGPVGQGLVELPVDAEPFQGGVLSSYRSTDPVVLAWLVVLAGWLLISRWRFAVLGHRRRR